MKNEQEQAYFDQLLANSETLNLRQVARMLLSRWYWIVGVLVVAAMACFLYLKLAKPLYLASITLKYSDKKSQLDELGGGAPTYVFGTTPDEYLTEKYNVMTPEVIKGAIEKLNNPFSFYRLKDLRRIDIYPHRPLQIEVLAYQGDVYERGVFEVEDDELSYTTENGNVQSLGLSLNTTISVPGLSFRILSAKKEDYTYQFVHNDPPRMVRGLAGAIDMDEVEEGMPIMRLSFKHHNEAYTKDFLLGLLEAYQEYDLRQKQQSSDLTIQFIREQTELYAGLLKASARELELFKQQNQLMNISESATEITAKVRDIEQQKNALEIEKAFIDLLEANIGSSLEPINYLSVGLDGSSDNVLLSLLERYNTLIGQRKELLLKYSPNAPSVRNMDEQLLRIRTQIQENIRLQRQKNTGTTQILNQNMSLLRRRFGQIPALEKNYIYLQSNFEVNKNIYSLLLNKEIESSISRAGMLPSFYVITQLEKEKVSPKPVQIVLLALFIGMLLGVGSVLAKRVLTSTFTQIEQIERQPKLRFLGTIYHFEGKMSGKGDDLRLFLKDRSIFTESLSGIRTKLYFKNREEARRGRVLVVTSEQSGEGKSFVTINLALSFTKIGKKVLVLGADLRRSRIHTYFDSLSDKGLSTYLQQPDKAPIASIIRTSSVPNLDYIVAGPPPFNPGELLQGQPMDDLLEYCRGVYDYILVDTAPVGLVSDNIPLLTKADQVIYIIRWLYSLGESYHLATQIATDFGIETVEVIVNDYKPDLLYANLTSGGSSTTSSYGYYRRGYSYRTEGYFDKPKKWGIGARVRKKLR